MNAVALKPSAQIGPVDPLGSDWDRMVGSFPNANAFHRSDWARTLKSAYGFQPCYLAEGRPDAPTTILPLMEVSSWVTGTRGVSLPFTDHCEPLGQDDEISSRLFELAVALGRQRHWRYLELRGGGAPVPGADAAIRYFGHRLSLDTGSASLFAAIKESTRRSIRKAERGGVVVTVSRDVGAMRAFYRLQCQTRRRHGLPPQPWSFFEALQTFMLSNTGAVVLASYQDTPVAGAVFLRGGDTATFKFGASDRRYQHLRASNLVMWRAIELFRAQGVKTLDFGRTAMANAGLRRFKLSWGATERCIAYFRYSLRRGDFVRAADRSATWPTRLFRIVPSPLARVFGELLYRHIA